MLERVSAVYDGVPNKLDKFHDEIISHSQIVSLIGKRLCEDLDISL